ncbi:16S rRNA (uracil(1498)-N(3))-methyltransferase [Flammeovirgaceae bacterium SG7u.111]|nr:16S rRNA (uracil(1498)-N(3))-methyltransferase [Flammeovirgaceae bacterium SG7u.132]WPO37044.1 16S rRNA (uracil(1498)-N(3))-methyltransferase [Flammeovirgaceae bacterium SG7u.111]
MNIILFEQEELGQFLPLRDERARHIMKVLGFGVGDSFDMGLVNGARGKGRLVEISEEGMKIDFALGEEIPKLHPITLLMAYVRPVNAQRILRDVTTLGVERIMLFQGEKSEKSYASAKAYSAENLKNYLREGAEQAFCTQIPVLNQYKNLRECLDALPEGTPLFALDNYEASIRLSKVAPKESSAALAIGPERGWSAKERDLFREKGYALASLGERVLRTETACVAAVSVYLGKLRVV